MRKNKIKNNIFKLFIFLLLVNTLIFLNFNKFTYFNNESIALINPHINSIILTNTTVLSDGYSGNYWNDGISEETI